MKWAADLWTPYCWHCLERSVARIRGLDNFVLATWGLRPRLYAVRLLRRLKIHRPAAAFRLKIHRPAAAFRLKIHRPAAAL